MLTHRRPVPIILYNSGEGRFGQWRNVCLKVQKASSTRVEVAVVEEQRVGRNALLAFGGRGAVALECWQVVVGRQI